MTATSPDVFLRYYEEFKDKIYNYLWYRCGHNRTVAEDLTQDVFLKAFEAFERFDQTRPFSPWIYRIAHNVLLNWYRDKKPSVDIDKVTIPDLQGIEENVGTKVEYEQMLKAIHKLPQHHRDVLLARYVEGLTNDEIAQTRNKTPGAVRVSVHRALNTLRDQLTNL